MDPNESQAVQLDKNKIENGNKIAEMLRNTEVNLERCYVHSMNKRSGRMNIDIVTKLGEIRLCPSDGNEVEVHVEDGQKHVIVDSVEALVEKFQFGPYGFAFPKHQYPRPHIVIKDCFFTATSFTNHLNGDLTITLQWDSSLPPEMNIPAKATMTFKTRFTKMMFDANATMK
jgi:hypothetical protein